MPIKKSELYSSIWKSCDELRGGMDASQYKDYVLVLLFVKYVSDKAASQKDYDLEVPEGGSFADLVKLKGDKDIGDKMNKVIGRLAEKNDLKGVINVADWNDSDKLGKGKDMVDRLSNLISIFEKPELDFRRNRAEGDDLLGDAYEYLMRHFATESGKSKGQFYTPAEVSRIMAKVIGVGSASSSNQTIHDPTCGSGSLLIKAHDEAKSATGFDLALYGQEMDNATRALARMNLILHDCAFGEVWQDNTLSAPHFKDPKTGALKTFDFVVANPPFSTKSWTNGIDPANDPYGRFAFGVPPKKNGDYAFLLHILACLKSTGKGAVILPHGVLFRGGAEATIRREVVRRGYIKGIIGLPPNLFFGTGIPACILVLDKEGAAARKGIFMIDASKGFIKDGNKNRLRAQDIHKIVDVFNRQIELPRYSRMVSLDEISGPKNDFNLNLPRYIDSSEPEDIQDIDGHLRGGIPQRDLDALERYWKVFSGLREALFKEASRPGYSELKVATADIKTTIFGHTKFTAWSIQTQKLFVVWRAESEPRLRAIKKGDKPKVLIDTLAEELLATFQKARLLDPYDVYQHLMDYWAEVMQDDVYLIASDGWREAAKPRPIEDKDKKAKDKPDFTIGKQKFKAELIPASLLIARYFAAEQAAIEKLESEAAAVTQAMEELAEEHGGEDGLLAEARNDKEKLTKASVSARLRHVKNDPDAADEEKVLVAYLALIDKEAATNAKANAAQEELTAKVAAKYGTLTEDDIKTLVVEDKWLAALEASVTGELDRVSQSLTGRVRELAERYASPLPSLTAELSTLAARVDEHLKKMGAIWN
ncbi:SAM-dependent DNA methyltransferase [Pyxidicoccus fallax]|uniref:site-specific DNA-methyltransferase (adenine-specific) n=1 Tax=Pyxidicoccus fallax TaxID=394095 RepID=A0A848LCI3_9BACT|nr:class I SAM-dependent DNA methyltransferase [Pyxidicoccus fallax]NMO14525.1 SAM-dependent DNA methyltransferase [Pyxidicoccus fallax]NPC77044.1 SAM-dependent DNA methyltransferase [Pyxidicoccus fallax]